MINFYNILCIDEWIQRYIYWELCALYLYNCMYVYLLPHLRTFFMCIYTDIYRTASFCIICSYDKGISQIPKRVLCISIKWSCITITHSPHVKMASFLFSWFCVTPLCSCLGWRGHTEGLEIPCTLSVWGLLVGEFAPTSFVSITTSRGPIVSIWLLGGTFVLAQSLLPCCLSLLFSLTWKIDVGSHHTDQHVCAQMLVSHADWHHMPQAIACALLL